MIRCDVDFSKLVTWTFPNSVVFCGVKIDVLQGGSKKSPVWSAEWVRFLASPWEERKNINLVTKDQLISDPHSNWQACGENGIK